MLETSRDYDELLDAWRGWHDAARPLRTDYVRFVELANEGARTLGFADLGAMWRSGYDMPADEFTQEAARLYGQVEPLYKDLHCYARGRLAQKYGEDKVPAGKPIPAHLLGNMWAQQWDAVYDLLEPYPGVSDLDVDAALEKQGYDAVRMTKSAETFYQSIAFPALPETFWERSMLTQPRDRDVQCHASAWHMDGKRGRAHQDVHAADLRGACARSTTSSATSITTSGTRTSRSCSRTARTTASTRPSATPSTCR